MAFRENCFYCGSTGAERELKALARKVAAHRGSDAAIGSEDDSDGWDTIGIIHRFSSVMVVVESVKDAVPYMRMAGCPNWAGIDDCPPRGDFGCAGA